MNLKYRLGVLLLSIGARLALSNENKKEKLKDAINLNTFLGGHAESGGHILHDIRPMCDYDTQSVVNVLINKSLLSEENDKVSVKKYYYSEHWV